MTGTKIQDNVCRETLVPWLANIWEFWDERQSNGGDPAQISALIKARGPELGGSDIGFAELTPTMINVGSEFQPKCIVSNMVAEDYGKMLDGALAVKREAFEIYVESARILWSLTPRLLRTL